MSLSQKRIDFVLAHVSAMRADPSRYEQIDPGVLQQLVGWHSCGFPSIVLGHRLAASLMCTSLPSNILLSPPWPEFQIVLPAGLLPYRDTHLAIAHVSPGNPWAFTFYLGNNDDPKATDWVHELDEETRRRLRGSVCDLVVGICIEMDTPPIRERILLGPPRHRLSKRKSATPTAWTFQLTRDVKVDMREAVRDYIFGRRGSCPIVQSFVRGHHKHQPCGPGGTLRKWIHIEPYWRGPEDAPIAVRAHNLESP